MDTSKVARTQVHPVDDLPSEESDLDDAVLAALPRVNGADPLLDSGEDDSGAEDEDSNDEWEMESLFEDTLEEMGDDLLFKGGEKVQNWLSDMRSPRLQNLMPAPSRKPARSDSSYAPSALRSFARALLKRALSPQRSYSRHLGFGHPLS
jgi:hypothetical protein